MTERSGNQAAVEAFHPSRTVTVGEHTFHLSIPTEEAEGEVLRQLAEVSKIDPKKTSDTEATLLWRRLHVAQLKAVLPDVEEDSLRALVRADVDLEPLHQAAAAMCGLKRDGVAGADPS